MIKKGDIVRKGQELFIIHSGTYVSTLRTCVAAQDYDPAMSKSHCLLVRHLGDDSVCMVRFVDVQDSPLSAMTVCKRLFPQHAESIEDLMVEHLSKKFSHC